jgi:thymidine kinase
VGAGKIARLIFTYGAVNSGKTTALLQNANSYKECNLVVRIFTYEGCDCDGFCKSRIGLSKKCESFNKDFSFHSVNFSGVSAFMIDEAQFLTQKQVFELFEISSFKNISIHCYGLRTSWRAKIFEGASALLSLADELYEAKTVCQCGNKASMSKRISKENLDSDEDLGKDKYIAVCRACWFSSMGENEWNGS